MSKKQTKSFQSEVKQILNLMIHSLYSNKEIFLRELISNASDAIDKLKFKALSNHDLYENDQLFKVRISIDKSKQCILISDNGIGMTKSEIIKNLGTIAKSGTGDFLKSLNEKNNHQFIGQFGVGFYSVFMVSKKVEVSTRAAGYSKHSGVLWVSDGKGEYTIQDITKESRGTDITLHIKDDSKEFLDYWKINNIVKKYSDYVNLCVEMQKSKDADVWEQVNKADAIWTRKKSEIKDTEYEDFYKYLANDNTDPITWTHNHVEGKHEYISLLYIPSKAPWNIWNRDYKNNIKLYIQRVFIMEDSEIFLPSFLRFVKGLIDSRDIPLNISRETLQTNPLTIGIRKSLTNRVLQMLENLASTNNKKYITFWNQFGTILKEGPAEDTFNSERVINLFRFASTFNENMSQNVSLSDYISRMSNNQQDIYYIISDSYKSALNNPHIEIFKKNKIEVLLLFDRIDEWMMNYLTSFQGKKLQSISKSNLDISKFAHNVHIHTKAMNSLIRKIESVLSDKIESVKFTNKLVDFPSAVTTLPGEIGTQMSKLFAATGQTIPKIKYIFEINPSHPLIKYLSSIEDDKTFKDWVYLLFDQALLSERCTLDNPNKFIKRINHLFLSKIIVN